MEYSRLVCFDKVYTAGSEQRRIRWRRDVIFHHANRLLLPRQPEHEFQKIATIGVLAGRAENTGCTQDERVLEIGLGIKFASQLRDGVGT